MWVTWPPNVLYSNIAGIYLYFCTCCWFWRPPWRHWRSTLINQLHLESLFSTWIGTKRKNGRAGCRSVSPHGYLGSGWKGGMRYLLSLIDSLEWHWVLSSWRTMNLRKRESYAEYRFPRFSWRCSKQIYVSSFRSYLRFCFFLWGVWLIIIRLQNEVPVYCSDHKCWAGLACLGRALALFAWWNSINLILISWLLLNVLPAGPFSYVSLLRSKGILQCYSGVHSLLRLDDGVWQFFVLLYSKRF